MGQGNARPGCGGIPGQAWQGCGELDTCPAAALLGQGLTALVLLLGTVGEPAGPWQQQAQPTMAGPLLLNLHASACLSFQPFILSTEKKSVLPKISSLLLIITSHLDGLSVSTDTSKKWRHETELSPSAICSNMNHHLFSCYVTLCRLQASKSHSEEHWNCSAKCSIS